VIPNTAVAKHSLVKVVVKTTPNTAIQITECNPKFPGPPVDQAACETARAGRAGGIFTGTTGATGKIIFEYPVLISATTAVGDGNCLTGGNVCWIQAQTSTGTPITQASFTTA
jgi:hypothetical protein